jgi:hypothetical protein
MAGKPSKQETKAFGAKAKASRTEPYMWGTLAEGATLEETKMLNSNRYPYRPLPSDDFDTEWMIRQQIAQPGSEMVSDARPLPWTEKEIQYLKDKRDAEEYAAYVDWIGHRFPMNDPANQRLMKEIVPSYFATRKALLQEQINLQAKAAQLRLLGPENEADLQLQYMIETGRIQIPQGPFHEPLEWAQNEMGGRPADNAQFFAGLNQQNARAYEKGLFNPFKLLTYKNAPWAPNALNMADIKGDPRVRALGPAGAIQPQNYNYGQMYRGETLGFMDRLTAPAQGRRTASALNQIAALPSVGQTRRFEENAAYTGTTTWSNANRDYRLGAGANVLNPAPVAPNAVQQAAMNQQAQANAAWNLQGPVP